MMYGEFKNKNYEARNLPRQIIKIPEEPLLNITPDTEQLNTRN